MAAPAKSVSDKGEAFRFSAFLADEVTREAAHRAAAQLGWTQAVVRSGGAGAALPAIDRAKPPSLLLVDIADATDPERTVSDLIAHCGEATRVITIGSVNDIALFRRLTALGVADYLVKPVSGELLSESFRRALQGQVESSSDAKHHARTVAFIGARGGVGTTTVALSVAWILLHEKKMQTAVIDLDLHFGNLALSLDLEPVRGMRQALENPERTDGLLLSSTIVKSEENLHILAAEESLRDMLRFEPDSAGTLLNALSQDYDCLIVDVPRALDAASRQILATAQTVVVVCDLSLASLRDAFRISDLVKSLGQTIKPLFVANQVGSTHRGEIGRAEFERGLGSPLDFVIPFDVKGARAAALTGKPLPSADRGSKAAAEMRRLATLLSGREAPTRARNRIGRWFW